MLTAADTQPTSGDGAAHEGGGTKRFTLRGVVVVACLVAVSLGYGSVKAWAAFEGGLLARSRAMLDLPAAWMHGSKRTVSVNGARIDILSGRADLSLTGLLDHAERACRGHAGGLDDALARTLGAASAPSTVLRLENERDGLVACLDLGEGAFASQALAARLSRFGEHLDLHELGGVRLLRAEALAHGSFFVVAAGEGAMPLSRMFPEQAEAPGLDPPHLPRPLGGRRSLSVYEEHAAPSITAYEAPAAVDDVWSGYLTQLRRAGWRSAQPDQAESAPRHAGLFVRGPRTAVVLVEPAAKGSRLVLLALD